MLVVDGGGSKRCALLGDVIAEMAHKNGWSVSADLSGAVCGPQALTADQSWQGIIINGCIRDSDDISRMPLGVKALAPYPLKSSKRDPGMRDVPITVAGALISPGDWIYADKDGVLVSKGELTL